MIALSLAALIVSAPVAVIDVAVEVGDGTRIDRATVIFDGALITSVGADAVVPANARRVDGRGKVLSPGLVAAGSQLGLFEVGQEAGAIDDAMAGPATPGFRAGDGFNPLSPHIAINREEGVTTVVLAPGGRKLLSGQGYVVELGSRLDSLPDVSKPVAVFGAFDGGTAESFGGSRGSLLLALREIFDDVRFYKANVAAFDKGASRDLHLSPTHLRALFPVIEGKVPLVVSVDRAADIRAMLAFAKEQKLKLVVDGGTESWLVAAELRTAGVPVIVHPSYAGVITFDALHARDDLAAVLHEQDVVVVIAGWEAGNGTTRLRQEAGIAVQNGMPHAAAIAAITRTPATLFGAPNAGLVRKGARASLVLWSGDPLEALTLSEKIWVGGVEITAPSRERLLAEKYKPKPK
ncbi:MAG: hypothetical protein Q8O67_06985 [Deltaproteobacteria bacterium]|nr:hypothetical protein [Deltaproteobacteria bacterium]